MDRIKYCTYTKVKSALVTNTFFVADIYIFNSIEFIRSQIILARPSEF